MVERILSKILQEYNIPKDLPYYWVDKRMQDFKETLKSAMKHRLMGHIQTFIGRSVFLSYVAGTLYFMYETTRFSYRSGAQASPVEYIEGALLSIGLCISAVFGGNLYVEGKRDIRFSGDLVERVKMGYEYLGEDYRKERSLKEWRSDIEKQSNKIIEHKN